MTAHTPGPWTIVACEVMEEDGSVYPKHIVGGELEHTVCFLEAQYVAQVAVQQPGTHWDTTPQKEANARLIAAAPDYHDAVQDIFRAVEANAAPINVIAALREISLHDGRVWMDPDLLISLFEAHAKAKGES